MMLYAYIWPVTYGVIQKMILAQFWEDAVCNYYYCCYCQYYYYNCVSLFVEFPRWLDTCW